MKSRDMRRLIAHEAARMIAEDGTLDYGTAKRKAARQLGAPDSRVLPDNMEIELALRSYQTLYQGGSQKSRLADLRQVAMEYMALLEEFDPHLTGPVLNGTAGERSEINLQLFSDDEKALEFFLMGKKIDYMIGESRHGPISYPSFRIHDPRSTVELVMFNRSSLGQMKRSLPDGSPRRLRLPQVRSLTVETSSTSDLT